MSKKLVENFKKFTERNLVALNSEQIMHNLYPINPMHTAEKIKDVEARGVKQPKLKIVNLRAFRRNYSEGKTQ